MTNAPYLVAKARWGVRMGNEALVDSMLHDGLLDPWTGVHMGITAENVAERFGIGRSDQDALASESVRRALHAIDAGHLREEIVPVEVAQRKGPSFVFDTDEFPRTRPAPDVSRHGCVPVPRPVSSRTSWAPGRSPPCRRSWIARV